MARSTSESARRFSLAHLLFLVPWVALVIDAWTPIGDNSFLWHIRAGELQLDAGSVLTTDPFSFTALGQPWLTQSWLAELLYGRLEASTGLGFVPWMLLVSTTLTFIGFGLIAYKASRNALATAIVLLLATVSLLSFLVPRPVLFSYLLFALVILAWESPRFRWALPFLFWMWASVHGSFFIGLGFIGLRWLARREWRWFGAIVVSGLATLLTAHGLGVVQMLFDFIAARPYLSLLTEWRAPELLSPVFLPVFVGLAIILIGAAVGKVKPAEMWIVIPFFALALTALRSVPPALIALLIPISVAMSDLGKTLPRRFGSTQTAIFGLAVLVIPFLLIGSGQLDEDRFPEEASDSLADGNIFHDDVTGGYLIWIDGPERLVFVDDRAELLGESLKELVDIRAGRLDWEPLFARYEISQALLRTTEPMVGWLIADGWAARYEDENFVLLATP